MAFVRLICKASKIEKLRKELEDEKKKSFEASQGKQPKYSVKQRYRHFWIDLRSKIRKWFKRKCTFPEKSCMYRSAYNLKHDGTCENFTLKSVVGFISGFFLTYIFFMFFVFILNFKLSTATIMCSFFGSILTIGLAFSYKVRCVVFLLLPQFFSKRGRQALMAYAFILAITGPAKNTLHNMGILSESLACGQEQLKAAVRQIIEVVKKPFYAIRDAIKSVVKTVKVIVKKIKEVLLTIKRIILAILRVIKAAFQFLGKILNICNKELGTPFERCRRVFENAITDCNAKLGPLFSWLCSIAYLVQAVCYIVKIFDFICMIVEFISDSIIGVVVRKVKIFVRHIRTMFYVRIKFSHSFSFETNQSKSMSEITTGIVTEIRQRTENILTVFDFMSCATSMFFLFIILRAMHYRYKFLTSERFDNRFITKNFRDIDMRRAQLEKETILPLNHRERLLYITVTSLRLVKSEKVKLSKAAVVLGMTTLKLSTHMMADYALYWVLTVIRYHARFQSTVQAPNIVGLHIEGKGFLANLLRSIVKAFQPLGINLEIDTVPCLPDPIPPDYDRYIQIASLLILCWILTIFEPYGLRLRHSVMCYYHPTRARQRAVWLYNHIMRSRSSFLKFARRQLRRKVTGAKGITKVTCKEYLRANIKFKLLRICLGSDTQDACLLCGEVFRESDPVKPIRCIKPGCPGIYCEQCYADLQNLCTVCMEPIQYGDLSDISEEKDSSEDEAPPKKERKKKKKKKCTISKCLKRKRDKDSDDEEDGLLQTEVSQESDSDYNSGWSSDNSYSYQNKKVITGEIRGDSPRFRDVEKQRNPDYVSWDSFVQEADSEKFLSEVDYGDSREIELKTFLPDKEDANLSSTSHSSLLSELKTNEISRQTSKVKLREGSKKAYKLPFTKTGKGYQEGEIPYKKTGQVQLGDDKVNLPKGDTKVSNVPYRDTTRSQKKGSKPDVQRRQYEYIPPKAPARKNEAPFKDTGIGQQKQKPPKSYKTRYGRISKKKKKRPVISSSRSSIISELQSKNDATQIYFSKLKHRKQLPAEAIPLTDRSYRQISTGSTSESLSSTARQPTVSSETETTFIDTPKKSSALQSGVSSSTDPEIKQCQKCGKYQRVVNVPSLNLDFDSPVSSNATTERTNPPNVTDRFRKSVQYEVIQETPSTNSYTGRSNTYGTLSVSPRSPLHINYQIYVPRYDKFVDYTDLLSLTPGKKPNDDSGQKVNDISMKIDEYKHNQRKKRIEDIAKNTRNLLEESGPTNSIADQNPENAFRAFFASNVNSSATQKINKANSNQTNTFQSQQTSTETYKQKVKDYYKEINNKQPPDNPKVTKHQSKFVKYIKRIFRKAKGEAELSEPSKSKFLSREYDKTLLILSPKFAGSGSLAQEDHSDAIPSTSTSGNEFLNQHSTGTSSRSSSSSLMGSVASHIRGGADSKLQVSDQTITTSGTSETTPTATTTSGAVTRETNISQTANDNLSSDSEISDIDIFFGRRSHAKYRKRKLASNNQSSNSNIYKSTSTPFNDKTNTLRTQMTTNTSTEESAPRYSREPAERDQDPDLQEKRLMRRFSSTPDMHNYWDVCTSSEMSPDYIDNVRGRCCACPVTPQKKFDTENRSAGYNSSNQYPDTSTNKTKSNRCPSSEISSGYIDAIRARCCNCPGKLQKNCNTENMNGSYSGSNQSPNSSTNKIISDSYPSGELCSACVRNGRGKCCICQINPQRRFNIEMLHEPCSCQNRSPKLPPLCEHRTNREHRTTINSPQEPCHRNRSSSEERQIQSPAIRFPSNIETSAQMHREYSSPCGPAPPPIYYNYPPCSPKIDGRRESIPEYYQGEPNNSGSTEKCFPSNSNVYGDNRRGDQYPNNYCACNSFEISSADVSPRLSPRSSPRRLMDDEVSHCSGCSGRSEFPDLVYQNTDEFFELVNELGDTLCQRNKERVQKAMREFEIKSSQNKNLEKPVFESDSEGHLETQRNERCCHYQSTQCNHCLRNRHLHQPSTTKFTRIETRRDNTMKYPVCPQRPGYVEKVVKHMDRNVDDNVPKQPKFNKTTSNTHWELNPRTGEWYKVYDDYYEYGDNYCNVLPPPPPPPRQICMCKRSPRRYHTMNSSDRQMRNYLSPPRSGVCTNCGFPQDLGY